MLVGVAPLLLVYDEMSVYFILKSVHFDTARFCMLCFWQL
jgi:hypothetical protein